MVRMLSTLRQLEANSKIQEIAEYYIRHRVMPSDAQGDASHLAYASFHAIDYLLTWNCTHMANASLQKTLFEYCTYHHLHMPVICTPELLTHPQS
jgi:hypothetical protein